MRSFGAYKSALLAIVTVAAGLLFAVPALAATGPVWSIQSIAVPTIMKTSDSLGAVDQVRVAAKGGTFTLALQEWSTGSNSSKGSGPAPVLTEEQTTGPIAFDAPASEAEGSGSVEAALNALKGIGGVGGSVSVTGGPGDELGSSPYVVTFGGKLIGIPEQEPAKTLGGPTVRADSALLSGGAHTATVTETTVGSTNDEYIVQVENIGQTQAAAGGTITDKLPPGVTTTGAPVSREESGNSVACSPGPAVVPSNSSWVGVSEVTCTIDKLVLAGASEAYYNIEADDDSGQFHIAVPVTVAAGVSGNVTNTATVSGGGAARSASVSASNPVNSSASPAFGVSFLNVLVSDEVGAPFTQAGGHPYAVNTTFGFNEEIEPGRVGFAPEVGGGTPVINSVAEDDPREFVFDLPLGLVGDPLAAPRCPLADVQASSPVKCPRDTQVGFVNLDGLIAGTGGTGPFALFNVVPEPGRPGEFAFDPIFNAVVVEYGTVVRTPLGNVVQVTVPSPRADVHDVSQTFYGNPIQVFGKPGEDENQLPFLINPTNCQASEAQRTFTMHMDSWQHPGALNPDGTPDFSDPNWKEASTVVPPVEGCGELEFNPSHFELAPSGLLEGSHEAKSGGSTQADEPSAYEGRMKIPQFETFSTLSRPELKSATVTLPAGLSVSASAANGLEGCSEAQLDPGSGEPGKCPEGSEMGTVEVTTPLLSKPLDGHVYLAEPKCGEEGEPACVESEAEEGKLFGLIIELDGEAVVKIPGYVEAGGYGAYSQTHGLAPGQLRGVFPNDPQVPFEELVFKFKEGPRTPLANPQTCGTFTTTSVLEPWSAPFSASATSESPFAISWNGQGAPCPARMPFNPGFTAGTASPAAGAYSPLTVEFSREDREQDLSGVTVHQPLGMLGNLSGVPLCGEAQANAGTCGEASEIGTTSAVVGPGEDPFTITGGRVYLTEGYKGGSFGLSIVVPANAGPFHLGNVVVRASIAVSPQTAALTVTSNPLPQVVDSVPIRLRKVVVDVNRPGFIFNATNCAPQKLEATLSGLEGFNSTTGSSVSVASPYDASGCTGLKFEPKLAVSTSGRTSKADGASLTIKLTKADVPQGAWADVAKFKVDLPKQLPSRLTTLQKACTAAQFEANPAGCPAASVVGHMKVLTPILPVALEGPMYFVSHGGEAFPSLEIVLQGYGVKVILTGSTFISRAGITSSTFNAIPDAPFSSAEVTLPEERYSALAANGNLCTSKLAMPTALVAQSGAEVHESTKIAVTGCAKAKKLTRAEKLKAALKACRKKAKGKRRQRCERKARKSYGPLKKAKKKSKAKK